MTYLSKISIRRDPAIGAIASLLMPATGNVHAGHHLVWSAFNRGEPGGEREFLFREARQGEFYVLSRDEPRANGVLEVESRPFAPAFVAGQRLAFTMTANPVRRRRRADGRTAKHDVVMDAIRGVPSGSRREARDEAVQREVMAWLTRQGERLGFGVDVDAFSAAGYRQHRVKRRGASPIVFATVEIEGVVTVTDPTAFRTAIEAGFGGARAFGCGLMLVRPVQ
jgi:CRISPR system Cascade subunit CasE